MIQLIKKDLESGWCFSVAIVAFILLNAISPEIVLEYIPVLALPMFVWVVGYNTYLSVLKTEKFNTWAHTFGVFLRWTLIFVAVFFLFLLIDPKFMVLGLTFYTFKYIFYELTGVTGAVEDDNGSG